MTIGSGTSVWHRAQIRVGATIGADCVIGRDAFIDEGVEIGNMVKIQNGALVYHGVTVEDGVFIGPGAILTNDRYPRAITSTGDLARADDWTVSPIRLRLRLLDRRRRRRGGGDARSVGSRRSAPVPSSPATSPPHALVVGSPAHRIGWVCACGVRLHDSDGLPAAAAPAHYASRPQLSCSNCGRIYLYVPDAEALQEQPRPNQGVPA